MIADGENAAKWDWPADVRARFDASGIPTAPAAPAAEARAEPLRQDARTGFRIPAPGEIGRWVSDGAGGAVWQVDDFAVAFDMEADAAADAFWHLARACWRSAP